MKFNKLPLNRQEFYNSHSVPKTRREFLSLGLISCATLSLSPSTVLAQNIFSRSSVPSVAGPDDPAFIVIDLAGGAGLSGNFLVGNKGGAHDLLKSYSTLGWNPVKDGYDQRFGAPMAKENISGIFRGIIQEASLDAQANFKLGTLLHVSDDDTSANPLSAASLVYNMGNTGNSIKQVLGLNSSSSAGNSRFASSINNSPFFMSDLEALIQAVGLNPIYGEGSKIGDKLFKLIKDVAAYQGKSFHSDINKSLSRSYLEAHKLAAKSVQLDPRLDRDVREIFNIQQNQSSRQSEVLKAAVVYNSLLGTTGPGVITIGGCDYHDNTSTTGDAKDLEVGSLLGRIVELSHRKKKKVFIQMITDGGVDATEGSRNWRGDGSAERSMSVMGVFDPSGTHQFIDSNKTQVGFYNQTETADQSSVIGASPKLAAYAAFANYLSVAGRIGEFEKLAPEIFSRKQLEEVLIFG